MRKTNRVPLHLVAFLLFIGYSLPNFSQRRIVGSVNDMEQKALPYASVRLLKTDSTYVSGITTDSLGCYRFANVASNKYLLFSTIGYKPQIIPVTVRNADVTVPTVTLESDDVMLGEIVVKGSSFIRQKDKVLIIPDKQQIKHANTGYDLLYNLMIPDIEVNRKTGDVSNMAGKVTLYINGEEADYREVQSLRPRDIEKVEYYDVPTGKYVGDNGSINYIVKNYQSGGYVFADGKQTIGYLAGDYNIGAKLSHGNTSYSVWGGHSMQKYDGTNTDKNETILFPDYTIYRNRMTTGGTYRNNQQYFQFKVNNSTKKRNLSAQVALVRNETPSNGSDELLDYSGHYTRSVHSSDGKNEKSLSPSARLYGDFNLGKNQTLEVTARGSYTRNDYTRLYTEDQEQSLTDVTEDFYSFRASAKYNIQLKHNNSFGVNISHDHQVASSSYAGDYASWQHLWMGESSFLLNYTQKFGEHFLMVLRPGLSWINYKLHSENVRRYLSLRTSSRFSYNFNRKQSLMLMCDIGANQPEISYINNVDQTVDFLQIKRGNPLLDDMSMYNVTLMYNGIFGRLNIAGGVGYSIYKNNIVPDYYIEGDKLINSYRSDGNIYGLGVQLLASYRITDNLRTKLTFKYLNEQTKKNYDFNINSYVTTLDVNYYLKDFSFNVFGETASKRLDPFTLIIAKTPASYGISVSWSHKGWYLEAGTENPFTKHARYKEHADYGIYKYSQIQTSRINQQTGYVKVAYTFDFGRKTSRDKNDVDRKINSAIMKVD